MATATATQTIQRPYVKPQRPHDYLYGYLRKLLCTLMIFF